MSACWSCHAATEPVSEPRCPSCKKLQPVPPGASHFGLLALPEDFDLTLAALDAAFRQRSLQVHPDRFARAEPRERRIAAERTAALNQAYAALKDPESRAAYLLQRVGLTLDQKPDPALLLALMESRERAEDDAAFKKQLIQQTRQQREALLARLHTQLQQVRAAAGLLDRAALEPVVPTVVELRYQGRLLDDLNGVRDPVRPPSAPHPLG